MQRIPGQYSLFGAAAAPPRLDDLEGVLLAGGHVSSPGDAARISVVVGERWRADALHAEFALRGVADAAPPSETAGGAWAARTARSPELRALALRWTRGAAQAPPAGLELTPGALRLWAIAAGRREESGFLFGTPAPDQPAHLVAGGQLSRLGLAAVSVPARGGPGWRVTSTRRLRRLTELVGEPPPGCGAQWPDGC